MNRAKQDNARAAGGKAKGTRIAGWLAAQLERIPRPGDSVTIDHARFVVRQMRRNRVTLVELVKREKSS